MTAQILDPFPSDIRAVAHQNVELPVSRNVVIDIDLDQSPGLRIHGRIPELVSVHFTQTLVSLDIDLSVFLS